MDPITNLAAAFDIAQGVMSQVPADAWSAQSPCSDWDARGVVNHMIGGAKMVAASVSGQAIDMSTLGGDLAGDDPAGAYRASADAAIAAFTADPSVLGRPVKMPFGEMPGAAVASIFTNDHFTHAWDIAKASGQSTDLSPQLAEAVLAATKANLSPEVRSGRFGPELTAPQGATAADQLAAFLGRQV